MCHKIQRVTPNTLLLIHFVYYFEFSYPCTAKKCTVLYSIVEDLPWDTPECEQQEVVSVVGVPPSTADFTDLERGVGWKRKLSVEGIV